MFPEGRIFDFLIVGVVALIVVGPKDLPVLMRKLGQFMAKVRGMAAEFRASFDEMAHQSELDDLRKQVDALRAGAKSSIGLAAVGLGANSGVQTVFEDIRVGVVGGPLSKTALIDEQSVGRLMPTELSSSNSPRHVDPAPRSLAEAVVERHSC